MYSRRVLLLSRATLFSGPGGDTVQMLELAKHLTAYGWQADVMSANQQVDYSRYALMHLFNAIRPADVLPHIHSSGLPYVVSPVFMDYSGYERKHRGGLAGWLLRRFSDDGQEYFKALARWLRNGESIRSTEYVLRGHRSSVQRVLSGANLLLPNSEHEYQRLIRRYGIEKPYVVVTNGVDTAAIARAAATPNEAYRGVVVCAARIEGNKNQLSLIRALQGLPVRLVFTGQAAPNHAAYASACQEAAGPQVSFLGRLPEHHDVLRILAAARVHVLPSHFETCGLSSLEAAALGTRIVVGDRGDVRDYFGDNAVYCDPDSVESIRSAVLEALNAPAPIGFAEYVCEHFTWAKAAEQTAEAYESVLRTS